MRRQGVGELHAVHVLPVNAPLADTVERDPVAALGARLVRQHAALRAVHDAQLVVVGRLDDLVADGELPAGVTMQQMLQHLVERLGAECAQVRRGDDLDIAHWIESQLLRQRLEHQVAQVGLDRQRVLKGIDHRPGGVGDGGR